MTLLDLLVVIAILIILVGVAIVAGNSARTRAFNTQALMCGEQVRKAQALYYSERQRFASDFTELNADMVARCALVTVTEVSASAQNYRYTVAHTRGNAKYTIEDDTQSTTLAAAGTVNGAAAGPQTASDGTVVTPAGQIPPGLGRVTVVATENGDAPNGLPFRVIKGSAPLGGVQCAGPGTHFDGTVTPTNFTSSCTAGLPWKNMQVDLNPGSYELIPEPLTASPNMYGTTYPQTSIPFTITAGEATTVTLPIVSARGLWDVRTTLLYGGVPDIRSASFYTGTTNPDTYYTVRDALGNPLTATTYTDASRGGSQGFLTSAATVTVTFQQVPAAVTGAKPPQSGSRSFLKDYPSTVLAPTDITRTLEVVPGRTAALNQTLDVIRYNFSGVMDFSACDAHPEFANKDEGTYPGFNRTLFPTYRTNGNVLLITGGSYTTPFTRVAPGVWAFRDITRPDTYGAITNYANYVVPETSWGATSNSDQARVLMYGRSGAQISAASTPQVGDTRCYTTDPGEFTLRTVNMRQNDTTIRLTYVYQRYDGASWITQ